MDIFLGCTTINLLLLPFRLSFVGRGGVAAMAFAIKHTDRATVPFSENTSCHQFTANE